MTAVSSVDLRAGIVRLAHGEHIPITTWLGPEDQAPGDNEDVNGYDWVHSVVAGQTLDGRWISVMLTDDDREEAKRKD